MLQVWSFWKVRETVLSELDIFAFRNPHCPDNFIVSSNGEYQNRARWSESCAVIGYQSGQGDLIFLVRDFRCPANL